MSNEREEQVRRQEIIPWKDANKKEFKENTRRKLTRNNGKHGKEEWGKGNGGMEKVLAKVKESMSE